MNTKIVHTRRLESNESDYKIFFLYGNRKNVLHPGYFYKVFMYKCLQVLSHKSTTDAAASPSYSYVIKPMFGTEQNLCKGSFILELISK